MRRAAISIIVSLCLIVLGHSQGWLDGLSNALGDLRFAFAARPATGQIVLVDIDKKTIDAIGKWPWPRQYHAQMLRRLTALGAAEVAFDVDFSSYSAAEQDEAFAAALRDAQGSVILAVFNQPFTPAIGETRIAANKPIPAFAQASWQAWVNVRADADSLVRRFDYGGVIDGKVVPSIAAMYGASAVRTGDFIIDFSIQPQGIARVSAIDVIQGSVDKNLVADKKIIIGAAATELRDVYRVPVLGEISGTMLEALGAESLLQGRSLIKTGPATMLIGLCLLSLLFLGILVRRTLVETVVCLAILAVGAEAAAILLQKLTPISVDTSAWQVALLSFLVIAVAREIDLRRVIIAISRNETRNARALLEKVIDDSFAGVVVADEAGLILSASKSAVAILRHDAGSQWSRRSIDDLLPAPFASAMRSAIAAYQRHEWVVHQPFVLELTAGPAAGSILEYVVTPSELHGGMTSNGVPRPSRFAACLTFRDVTHQKLAEAQLMHVAHYDALTDLPNRYFFSQQLNTAMATKFRRQCAVLYFDLDRFKAVNDTLGHVIGDKLLIKVGERVQRMLEPVDMVARVGGDEFAILRVYYGSREQVAAFAQGLIGRLSDPYEVDGHRLFVGVSIGIAFVDRLDTENGAALALKHADTALYKAKATGGNCFCFYEEAMDRPLIARRQLEVELHDAMANAEFRVHYQPQIDLKTRKLTGVEALVRWQHPTRGMVSPAEFVPVAEDIGLIEHLGGWVLRQACTDVAGWPGSIKLSVNVSPVQFTRGDLVKTVSEALAVSGLSPDRLDLEITESLFVQEGPVLQQKMTGLLDAGVSFSLDDFGTGYSSLSYIRRFPIAKIKIDRSFVSELPQSTNSVAIIRAVTALSESLGIRTNAEGVESQEQADALRLLGCNEGQGYFFGKPEPGEDIARRLQEERTAKGRSTRVGLRRGAAAESLTG